MRSKLILCGLPLPFLLGCATNSPPPLPVRIPPSLTAPCQRPVPPVLQTNEDLAQAYLDSRDSLVACAKLHSSLVKALTLNPLLTK